MSEGNPQTVADLYWLFTSTRMLSSSYVREQFMVTLTDILQERFSPDGILVHGLRNRQQTVHSLHYVGNVLPVNGVAPEEVLHTAFGENGGRHYLSELDENVVCSLVASIPIGPELIGAVMIQKNEESDKYSDRDLEALVALCRAVGRCINRCVLSRK